MKMQARLYSLRLEFRVNTVTNLRITLGGRDSFKSRAIDNISRETQPKRSSVAKISHPALGAI